jgi:hypothetical protein
MFSSKDAEPVIGEQQGKVLITQSEEVDATSSFYSCVLLVKGIVIK